MLKKIVKILFFAALSSSIFIGSVFATEGGGGIGGGGGGGRRRDEWMQWHGYDFDPSYGVDPAVTDMFLTLHHVDVAGDFWFLVNGLPALTPVLNNTPLYTDKSTSTLYDVTFQSGTTTYDAAVSSHSYFRSEIYLSSFMAPVDGHYRLAVVDSGAMYKRSNSDLIESNYVGFSNVSSWNYATNHFGLTTNFYGESQFCFAGFNLNDLKSGDTPWYYGFFIPFKKGSYGRFTAEIYLKCVPDPSVLAPRPGDIIGDIFVIGDDNEVTVYKDCQLVDETNLKFYNPTLNIWVPYVSFYYDYSTYTYNFVTDIGDEYSISYGDEILSISETVNSVTTIYNYYYGDGSDDGDDGGGGFNFWEWLMNRLGTLFDTVVGVIGDIVTHVINAIIDWILDLVDALIGFITRTMAWFGNIFTAPGDFFDAISDDSGLWDFYKYTVPAGGP